MLDKNSYNKHYRFSDEYVDLINQHPIMSLTHSFIKECYIDSVPRKDEIAHIYQDNISLVLNYFCGHEKPINGGKYFYDKEDYDFLLNKMNEILKMYKDHQIDIAMIRMEKDFE